jgi:hypothetical protein
VTSERFTTVPIGGDVAASLASVPAVAGVGQILGPEGRNLIIGRAAHLRRWAASHLGGGKTPRPGVRPPTNLAPIATAIAYAETTSAFHQRLVYERLMAGHVAPSARRDLKTPGYLHVDEQERFPRVAVTGAVGSREHLYGPFRDRRAAERARDRLHKLFPLRPCDYAFEPDPGLPLGLGCVYAQVRSCAAPCLARVSEDEYRALASDLASLLARPEARSSELAEVLPPWILPLGGAAGLVAERGARGLELYPVREGAVLEEGGVLQEGDLRLEAALGSVAWAVAPGAARDDRAWLSSWLHTPRRTGVFLAVDLPIAAAPLADRLRDKLGLPEGR